MVINYVRIQKAAYLVAYHVFMWIKQARYNVIIRSFRGAGWLMWKLQTEPG